MTPPHSRFLCDYPIKFFRNQKIIGPVSDGKRPAPGSEVFVSRIPEDTNEADLFPFFSKVGNIFRIRMMVQTDLSKSRGFCYVTFTSPEEAHMAIKILNSIIFRQSYLSVEKSFDNCRLFIGGVPDTKSKDEVWRELTNSGIRHILDVIMYRSYTDRAKNRGFVFVEFESHQKAAEARLNFKHLRLWGLRMVVDWSTPLPDVDVEVLNKVKVLFFRNLSVTERKEIFENILTTVLYSMSLEKVFRFKDYAFVHFTTREYAEIALKKLKQYYADTKVEVTWAVPQQYAPRKRHLRAVLPERLHSRLPLQTNHRNWLHFRHSTPQPPLHQIVLPTLYSDLWFNNFSDMHNSISQTSNDSLLDYDQVVQAVLATSTPIKRTAEETVKSCSSEDSGVSMSRTGRETSSNTLEDLVAIPEEYVPSEWSRERIISQSSDLGVSMFPTSTFNNYNSSQSYDEDDTTHSLVMSVVELVLDK